MWYILRQTCNSADSWHFRGHQAFRKGQSHKIVRVYWPFRGICTQRVKWLTREETSVSKSSHMDQILVKPFHATGLIFTPWKHQKTKGSWWVAWNGNGLKVATNTFYLVYLFLLHDTLSIYWIFNKKFITDILGNANAFFFYIKRWSIE